MFSQTSLAPCQTPNRAPHIQRRAQRCTSLAPYGCSQMRSWGRQKEEQIGCRIIGVDTSPTSCLFDRVHAEERALWWPFWSRILGNGFWTACFCAAMRKLHIWQKEDGTEDLENSDISSHTHTHTLPQKPGISARSKGEN